MKKVYNKIS